MKKITETIRFKKILGMVALCFGLNSMADAQCNAAYTYTAGASGNVSFNSSYGVSGSHYNWYFDDDAPTSLVASPTHTYQYNGTYTVTLFVEDSLETCRDSTSQIITITNGLVCNPNASFTYSTSSDGQINFTNTSTNLPAGTLYNWSFGDGSSSSQASPSYTYNHNSVYTVNLGVFAPNSTCSSWTSQTFTITNADSCSLHVSYTYTLAGNGDVYFMNTSTGINPNNNTTVSWSFGNGSNTSYQNYVTNTYAYNGTYLATLHIGDSTSACYGSITNTIVITNAATAPVCQANFNDSLFSNGAVSFTNQSTGTVANTTYLWSFGFGATSSTSMNPSFTYTANGVYNVTLSINNSLTGCSSSVSDSVHITNINTSPVCQAHFSYSLSGNNTAIFVNQSSGTTANTNYYWDFGDGYSSSTLINPSFTYTANGFYHVTLSITDSSTGCSSSHTDSIYITHTNPACLATVSFIMHKDSINPQPGVWEISPVYSSNISFAYWYWGDGTYSTGLYPTHTYAAAGQYNICVSVVAPCGDSSYLCQSDSLYRLAYNNSTNGANSMIQVTIVNSTTGIKTNTEEIAQISLYPNPNAGVFTLNLTNLSATKAQIKITNVLGEVVYSMQETVTNNTLTKAIDLQSMANGAYFMKAVIGEKSYTQKIIINK